MKFRVTIDEEGGFVVPREILEQLGWDENTLLRAEHDGKVGTIFRVTEEELDSREVAKQDG